MAKQGPRFTTSRLYVLSTQHLYLINKLTPAFAMTNQLLQGFVDVGPFLAKFGEIQKVNSAAFPIRHII